MKTALYKKGDDMYSKLQKHQKQSEGSGISFFPKDLQAV